jgi:hypothetical protein
MSLDEALTVTTERDPDPAKMRFAVLMFRQTENCFIFQSTPLKATSGCWTWSENG